ncbi:restriction endonuclease [Tautonia rosea]|uniref:restriction endonuclease n=1 Tax=Tautonia rosea TaxID=2728037 RepID=UPI0014745FF3
MATVLEAFDQRASVTHGRWVIGPDGRREIDVLIEGTVDGVPVKGLVECKDFNPRRPVGIAYVDALDSKRHDLRADFTMLCSNAGFTADAVRKAKRLGIALAGVMKKGDARLRFSVIDEIYIRKVQLQRLSIRLMGPDPIHLANVPLYDILWNGMPVANWIHHRIILLLGFNPIVAGTFRVTHNLLEPQIFTWPGGEATVTNFDFAFTLVGGWFTQRVEIDSTAAIYDWIRRRVRMTPGDGQLVYRNVNFDGGTPVIHPPDMEFLRERFLEGETEMKLLILENLDRREPVPDLDAHVEPADLELFIEGLKDEIDNSSLGGSDNAPR